MDRKREYLSADDGVDVASAVTPAILIDHHDRQKRATLALIGASLSTYWSGALVFGYPGVMGGVWAERANATEGQLGWIMTLIVFSLGIFTFYAGKLHLRIGTRKSYVLGTVILVVAMLVPVFSNSVAAIYIWAFLNGTASCFVYAPSLATVQHWFPHRRGMATGVVNLVFGLSGAVAAPLFSWMAGNLSYEAGSFIIIGLILATNLIAALITELPAVSSLSPGTLYAQRLLWQRTHDDPKRSAPAPDMEPRMAVRTGAFWWIWVAWAFMGAAGISMVSLSRAFGDAANAAGIAITGVGLLMAFNLTNGLSRIIAGVLSDTIGRHRLGAIAFLGAGLGYAAMPFTSHPILLGVEAALVGFAFGTLFAITAPLGTDLFGLKHFGVIFGLIFTAYGFVGGIVGPLLSSYVLEATGGNFTVVFGYLAVLSFIAAGAIMLAKRAGDSLVARRRDGRAYRAA